MGRQALVLLPNRDLCTQVHSVFEGLIAASGQLLVDHTAVLLYTLYFALILYVERVDHTWPFYFVLCTLYLYFI